ncbi:MAG: hypothetical protein ACXU84_13975, partial [Xanthobacteraceae bacterium]
MIAGPRRFDGGIEREQIGLVRDMTHGLGHVSDACRLLAQLFDDRHGGGLALAVMLDVARPRSDLVRGLRELPLQCLRTPARGLGAITRLGQGRGRGRGHRERLLRGAGGFL